MIFAHGVGSRGDLPLPLWMFTWASAIAIVVSFVALGVLWVKPQLARRADGRVVVGGRPLWLRVLQFVGRTLALGLLLLALAAGLVGTDSAARNILPVTLYVIVWVGVQLLAGTVGDFWRAINPLVTIVRILERLGLSGRVRPGDLIGRLGQWPAALGLFVFLFYELAHPSGASPRTLVWMLLVHLVVSVGLGVRYGSEWLATNEPFSALFEMVGRMGILSAGPDSGGVDRGLRLRPPMTGLATMPVLPGTLAALLIVLGGTTFDGFVESEAGRSLFGRPEGWSGAFTLTVGLVGSIVVIAALYAAGVAWTARVTELSVREAAVSFTPSLVPIVFGYAIAHYAQLIVDETQTFVFHLSDPFGQGWDLFGGADATINFNLISPDLIAWVQILAILFGHVGAVMVAHDRSVELFRAEDSLRSQFAMLLVMVAYSTLGLWLLMNA